MKLVYRKLITVSLAIIAAAVLGMLVRPSGIYAPDQQPTPTPEPLMAEGSAASGYVAAKESCRTPGHGRVAYCWFEGWAFARKTVCIDSNIPSAPLAKIAYDYNRTGTVRIVVGAHAGSCAQAGYPASQRVSFLSMSLKTARHYRYGVCGLTYAGNYGTLQSIMIAVYVTGSKRTPCGGDPEWMDVFRHELGHALGLSHDQKYVSSLMRDGHSVSAQDRAELAIIYGKRRY